MSNSLSRDWIFNNAAKIMERYRGNNGGECSLEEVSRSMIKCLSTGRRWRRPLLAALHEDTSFTRTRSSRRTVLAPVSTTVLFPSSRPLASPSFYMDERSLDYPGIILIRPWRRRKVSLEDVLAGYNRPSQITGRKSYDFVE